MNVFQTHANIVGDYANYIRSFLKIADPAIRDIVEHALDKGTLWPEALLQFNPSFEMFGTVDDLAGKGRIHPVLKDIFRGYSLYRHQVEAIRWGVAGKDFVVTSGTGSGKSLTYIGSIFHHLLSNPGSTPRVQKRRHHASPGPRPRTWPGWIVRDKLSAPSPDVVRRAACRQRR